MSENGSNLKKETIISLREAVTTGIVIDLILLGIAGTVMDCGEASCAAVCLVSGHWAGNFWIIFRRRSTMTKTDKDFIRFGSIALIPVAAFWLLLVGAASA